MATQQGPPPPREGLDLATLVISALASAAAAYITSKIWAPGTLVSAAFTPVIVALVKEGLRKPTEVITNVVPQVVPTPSRWTRAGADDPGLVPEVHAPEPPPADAPPVLVPGDHAPVRVYSTRGRRLRWRLAVVTGLLGFAIAVLALTVPELIAGQSLGGSHKTTIFGGPHRHRSSTTKTTTSTTPTSTSTQRTTTTATTPTRTTTVTRTQTVTRPAETTPAAPSTAAPSSSAAPSSTAPPG